MNFSVGQQILDGRIVVAAINDDGSVVLQFPQLGDYSGPFAVTVRPDVTLDALRALLDALLAVAP